MTQAKLFAITDADHHTRQTDRSPMNHRRFVVLAIVFAGSLADLRLARSAAIVLDNQSTAAVSFTIRWPDNQETQHRLVAGDLAPVAVTGSVGIAFDVGLQRRRYALQANNIYRFVDEHGTLELSELPMPDVGGIDLATVADPSRPLEADRSPPADEVGAFESPPKQAYSVSVKLLADDLEPTRRAIWEKRLRDRMAAASAIFERHCRVQFQVVAVETWQSDHGIRDFEQSVAEFERKVHPAPARLAIGFTGRYEWVEGESHVGGIRGPLRPHILIREALAKVSELERLEVLVHELGHFLGAVHAAGTSVMRPTLGDRQACRRGFRIGFDAPNTLAMYLLGEELARRPIVSLYHLSPEVKAPLRRIYASWARALPSDPAAPKYLALLELPFPSGR
jgi:hypothetical protein